jgi:alpha-mannosidase
LKEFSQSLEFNCKVEWLENRRLLKAEIPTVIHSEHATYETQFGLVQRPTHRNTSWDVARFECCGHRFIDVYEPGLGVSLITDCKYGYSAIKNASDPGTTLTVTLLKAPKAPDLNCDMGNHYFKYVIYAHKVEKLL